MFYDPARASLTVAEFLDRFTDVETEGNAYVVNCAGHADSKPSLRVAYNAEEKKLALKCRAGCRTQDVVAALGLPMSALFDVEPGDLADVRSTTRETQALSTGDRAALAQYLLRAEAALDDRGSEALAYLARRFGVSAELAREQGVGFDDGTLDAGQVVLSRRKYRNAPRVTVPFVDFDGNPHGFQGRALTNAEPRWSGPNNPDGATWGRYGVLTAGSDHPAILLTEGPGDGLTAVAAAYDAVVIPGASRGTSPGLAGELAASLQGRQVIVAGDNDTAGEKFARNIAGALATRGIDVRRLVLPAGVSDLADWYGLDGDGFAAALADAVAQADALLGEGDGAGAGAAKPDYDEVSIEDSPLAQRIAEKYLRGRWCYSDGLGWLHWDGRRWETTSEIAAQEAIRRALLTAHDEDTAKADRRLEHRRREAERVRDKAQARLDEGGTSEEEGSAKEVADKYLDAIKAAEKERQDRLKAIRCYFWGSKIRSTQTLAKGILREKAETFDAEPYLLNVGNGVVDLRTGKLGPHRPELRFTKISEVNYVPGATHVDWDTALEALTPDVRDWMQLRFGQAATALPPDDDIVPFLYGGGQNGKSSVLAGVRAALGEFARAVPEKALISNPGDHTTELTVLLGARLAILEELPQGRWLDVKRLKTIAGTDKIVARKIAKDPIEWDPTHSLFITTNYELRVDENDHGTWRRLARVPFPFTFGDGPGQLPADPGLRGRVNRGRGGQHEAALAWVVAGASRWFADRREILPKAPAEVVASTKEWRSTVDVLGRFLEEMTELDEGAAVKAQEFYEAFTDWCEASGHHVWSDQLLWERFRAHDWMTSGAVTKPPKGRPGGRKLYSRQGTPTSAPSGPSRYVFGLKFTAGTA